MTGRGPPGLRIKELGSYQEEGCRCSRRTPQTDQGSWIVTPRLELRTVLDHLKTKQRAQDELMMYLP